MSDTSVSCAEWPAGELFHFNKITKYWVCNVSTKRSWKSDVLMNFCLDYRHLVLRHQWSWKPLLPSVCESCQTPSLEWTLQTVGENVLIYWCVGQMVHLGPDGKIPSSSKTFGGKISYKGCTGTQDTSGKFQNVYLPLRTVFFHHHTEFIFLILNILYGEKIFFPLL